MLVLGELFTVVRLLSDSILYRYRSQSFVESAQVTSICSFASPSFGPTVNGCSTYVPGRSAPLPVVPPGTVEPPSPVPAKSAVCGPGGSGGAGRRVRTAGAGNAKGAPARGCAGADTFRPR